MGVSPLWGRRALAPLDYTTSAPEGASQGRGACILALTCSIWCATDRPQPCRLCRYAYLTAQPDAAQGGAGARNAEAQVERRAGANRAPRRLRKPGKPTPFEHRPLTPTFWVGRACEPPKLSGKAVQSPASVQCAQGPRRVDRSGATTLGERGGHISR